MTPERLFGILNLNKPAGVTSRDVVNVVQRLVRPDKCGHAGTLDPLATGVLVVAVGRATRLIPFLQEHPKTYRGSFRLGLRSPTDDITGEVTASEPNPDVKAADLERLLPEFQGRIRQRPPQFSAVHVDGERAYARARRGEAVDVPDREVVVERIELVDFSAPDFTLEIECGSGTYIRSIGRDLGEQMGCGAVMTALVRTRVGPFALETAIDPDELTRETLADQLLPATSGVPHFSKYRVETDDLERIRVGRAFRPRETFAALDRIALRDTKGRLVAVGNYVEATNEIAPTHVFI